jgi:hypothetical protein
MRSFGRNTFRAALMLAGALCGTGCEPEIKASERYPGPWQDLDAYVAVAMAKKPERLGQLCHSAYMRPAFNRPGERSEYLVYCTFDRSEWWSFFVFTGMDEVVGPNYILADVPPPG